MLARSATYILAILGVSFLISLNLDQFQAEAETYIKTHQPSNFSFDQKYAFDLITNINENVKGLIDQNKNERKEREETEDKLKTAAFILFILLWGELFFGFLSTKELDELNVICGISIYSTWAGATLIIPHFASIFINVSLYDDSIYQTGWILLIVGLVTGAVLANVIGITGILRILISPNLHQH